VGDDRFFCLLADKLGIDEESGLFWEWRTSCMQGEKIFLLDEEKICVGVIVRPASMLQEHRDWAYCHGGCFLFQVGAIELLSF
jgi:hypothetical protein